LAGPLMARSFEMAGPPAICHPFDIGDAKSIAVKDGEVSKYDASKVVNDTLGALDGKAGALVRMETIRRAWLVLQSHDSQARDLFARLMSRALVGEAKGSNDWRPWFDAAYFVGAGSQLERDFFTFDPGEASGCLGYGWMKKAISLDKDNAEMQ